MLETIILFLITMFTGGAVIIQTMNAIDKMRGQEVVPGPRWVINKIGWWYLPIEMSGLGIMLLCIVVLVPYWSIYILLFWSGYHVGIFYRDYYAIKFVKEQRNNVSAYLRSFSRLNGYPK